MIICKPLICIFYITFFISCKQSKKEPQVFNTKTKYNTDTVLASNYQNLNFLNFIPDTIFLYINKLSVNEVKKELIKMYYSDQGTRDSLHKYWDKNDLRSKAVQDRQEIMGKTDKLNRLILASIINKYGWPTLEQFGDTATKAAWYVTIHSDLNFQEKYISIIKSAAINNKINPLEYAILQDRILLYSGKKLIYGTHGYFNKKKNQIRLLKIDNITEVNRAREQLGLKKLKENFCDIEMFPTVYDQEL